MKKLFYLAIFVLFSPSVFSQYNWDFGLKIGGANYLGDIGGKASIRRDFVWDMHMNQTNIAVGAYGRYKFSKRMAVAVNFDYLQINDSDSETTNPSRRARNMNFRNRIKEFGIRAELTIFYDSDVGGKGYYDPGFKLYAFGGISVFHHQPQGQIFKEGELQYLDDPSIVDGWHKLQPWQTEGVEYNLWGVAVPAGIGMYFTFDKTWRFGWELSWRTTFTDYLDDVSTTYVDPATLDPLAAEFASQTYQGLINEIARPELSGSVNDHRWQEGFATKRGDPTHNDSYLTSQFTIGRVIRGRSNFYKKKYSWLKNRTGSRRSRAKF